jgi:hypothetical protein
MWCVWIWGYRVCWRWYVEVEGVGCAVEGVGYDAGSRVKQFIPQKLREEGSHALAGSG